jgi:steroid delta-isomerase-like uncharacterized protein
MTSETTGRTMTAYLEALAQRGPFAQYFSDEVIFALVGTPQEVKGRDAVEQFIRYFHEQAFDARPEVKSTTIGDVRAAAEFVFVGTHTGEFAGVPASGNQVNVPYAVVYDLRDAKITALRAYIPMDLLLRQISAPPAVIPAGS